jgi:ribose transport system ATP-binding protein
VSFDLHGQEILGLVGENGAGKSTLVRILAGVHPPDEGKLRMGGSELAELTPKGADTLGIQAIHQEFTLAPNLTVAENIFLGHEPRRLGVVDFGAMRRITTEWLKRLGIAIDAEEVVGRLGVANQQLVEITRAVAKRARVLIMDEPTSALSSQEVKSLFRLIREFRDQGVALVFISHRLDEVMQLCDRALVLRDGEKVAEFTREEFSKDKMIRAMVGREVRERTVSVAEADGRPVLEVRDFVASYRANKHLSIPHFVVRAGEIVGLAGLMGAGRSEFAHALVGSHMVLRGNVFVNGNEVNLRSPRDAIDHGIGFVPESRKEQALFLHLTVRENLTMARLPSVTAMGVLRARYERALAEDLGRELDIRPRDPETEVVKLSGGNQQKVVIGRWLAIQPRVLILDEPTRGIDVGAKEEIYRLIERLVEQHVGVVIISSDLPELLRVSHRIVTLMEGEVTGEVDRSEATQEKVMWLATHRPERREEVK